MVTRFGMDETVGQRTYSAPPQPFLGTPAGGIEASATTEREIDVAVRDIITKAFEQATSILRTRRTDLDEGAACNHRAVDTIQIAWSLVPADRSFRPFRGFQLTAPESRPKSVAERAMRSVLGMTQS
jgi:hypothetical protein